MIDGRPTGGSDGPVFVVGVARSGTTLLASMLGAHGRLDAGPETRFLIRLARAPVGRILEPSTWPDEAVRFVASLRADERPAHEAFGVPLDDVRTYLRGRPPSVPALLESLTATRAASLGKARWVEKTPDHLLRLADLRRHWPDAPVVRIVRDPRDVATSLRSVRFGSPSFAVNLYAWADRDARSWRWFETDPRSLTVRYEDLVRDPVTVLTGVTDFIGEAFEPGMLETQESARRAAGPGEAWKRKAGETIDASRAESWRRGLGPDDRALAAAVCHDGLLRYGYADARASIARLALQPLTEEFIAGHEALLVTLAERGIRAEPWPPGAADELDAPSVDAPRAARVAFYGASGQLRWRWRPGRRARVAGALDVIRALVHARRAGRPALWLGERSALPPRAGALDRVADVAARRLSRPGRLDELSGGDAGASRR